LFFLSSLQNTNNSKPWSITQLQPRVNASPIDIRISTWMRLLIWMMHHTRRLDMPTLENIKSNYFSTQLFSANERYFPKYFSLPEVRLFRIKLILCTSSLCSYSLPIWPVILFREKDVLMKFKNASWMVIFKDNLIDNSILQRNLSQKVLYENMNLSKPICQ